MSIGAGEVLLEIAATRLLPVLVEEVGGRAVLYALRTAARSAGERTNREERTEPVRTPEVAQNVEVLAHVPGRVRLRVAGLRGDPVRATAVRDTVLQFPGVRNASASAITGTALIEYDPRGTTLAEIQAALQPLEPLAGGRAASPITAIPDQQPAAA